MRQIGEGIEAFSLTTNRLGKNLTGQVRIGNPMPAATLGIVDIATDTADLGQARQCQQEVAGP